MAPQSPGRGDKRKELIPLRACFSTAFALIVDKIKATEPTVISTMKTITIPSEASISYANH